MTLFIIFLLNYPFKNICFLFYKINHALVDFSWLSENKNDFA